MTDYLKKSFSVTVGAEETYRSNWERIFGKPEVAVGLVMHGLAFDRKTTRCGLEFGSVCWTSKDENVTCPGCK